MYRHLFRGIFWGLTSSVGVILIQLLMTLVVGRQSSAMLGLLNTLEVVVGGYLAFCFVGGSVSLANHMNRNPERSVLPQIVANLGGAVVVTVVGILLMFGLGWGDSLGRGQLLLLAGCGLAGLAANQFAAERAALLDFRFSNFQEKGGFFFLAVGMILLTWAGLLTSLAILVLALILFGLVALLGFWKIRKPSAHDWSRLKSYYTRPVFYYTATYAMIFFYERIDQILILHYFDLATLGIYFVCYKMSFSVRLLSSIIVKAAYPIMSRMEQTGGGGQGDIEIFLLRINYIIAVVSAVGLCLGADFLLGLYGEPYLALKSVLMIMAVTRVAGVVNLVLANTINARGEGATFFGISTTTVMLQVAIMALTVDSQGIKAMALSRLGAVLLGNVTTMMAVRKMGKLDPLIMKMSLKFTTFAALMAWAYFYRPSLVVALAIVGGLGLVLFAEFRQLWSLWLQYQRKKPVA
ncbi:hypothetical protein CSB20_12460 [bacterium DOLZORAL124_64_63]|nr:MAG: hypothetical protein CSB20_12460 [bacterium DOLZORAL124_64_63]